MNVRDRVLALRSRPADQLRAAPPQDEERDVTIDGKKHTIITWHDEPQPGHHRFVVASYKPAMFGLASRITALGFVLLPDGTARDLTEEELSEFQ